MASGDTATDANSAVAAEATLFSPPLREITHRVIRRVRALRALRSGGTGLLCGAFVTLALLCLMRLRVFDPETANDILLLLPPIGGLALGALWGATRPIAPLAALRLAEQRLDLKERLSTAYVFASTARAGNRLVARQLADAEQAASSSLPSLAAVLPWRPLPRVVGASLFASLAAFLLWFLPTVPLFQSPAERAERAAVRKEGERLVRIAKVLEAKAGDKKLENARLAAAKLSALGKEMQLGKMSQRKAMMRTAKLSNEMKQAQQAIANRSMPQKSLAAASRSLAQATSAAGQNAAAKAGGNTPQNGLKIPQNLGSQNKNASTVAASKTSLSDAAIKKLIAAMAQNDSASLAEQLAKLADKAAAGEPRDDAERRKMAEQLARLAEVLEKTSLSPASESLRKAAEALKKTDLKEVEKQLREAARRASEAQKSDEEASALQQMADAMSGASAAADAVESPDSADTGEGQDANDAFGKNGTMKSKKGHVHTAECLQPGGMCRSGAGTMNPNGGNGKSGQGIGSGAGKIGGKKPDTQKWSPYQDARNAPKGNKNLNRPMQTNQVRNDDFARLYAPDSKTANTRVKGKRSDKGRETVSYFRAAPDKADAKVPYYEVYGQYAPAAESALNREDIPSSYKKQVKEYFEALNPGTRSGGGDATEKGKTQR